MRFRFVVVALVSLLARPHVVHACGGGLVSSVAGQVGNDVQRIVLSVHDGKTDVVTQIAVPATSGDYGALIPVPSNPTLDPQPVDAQELTDLDQVTAPRFEQKPSHGFDIGCGGAAPTKSAAAPVAEPAIDIGPVTAVVLRADDTTALQDWLATNAFTLNDVQRALVGEYTGAGRFFIAIRRNDKTATGGASSVGVHFALDGDQRVLPLRFARIGAAGQIAFTVFVASPIASAPAAPFSTLSIFDLDDHLLAAGDYRGAVAKAVADHHATAFVVEGAYQVSDLERPGGGLGAGLGRFVQSGQRLTRLTTVLDSSALVTDAALTGSLDSPVPTERTLSFTAPGGMTIFAGLGALAGVIGRRRRHTAR